MLMRILSLSLHWLMQHDLQMKLEEQNAKDMDRERFIAGMKEGAPFSGVIDRSNKMIEGRRKNIVSTMPEYITVISRKIFG